MTTSHTAATAMGPQHLRARITGRVVEPSDPDFDALCTVMVGGVDARPALLARPLTDDDVAQVVRFAQESGLELAVRSGGHSSAAHSTVDGGLVLDVRDMTGIDIDPAGRTVWAEAGLTAAELTRATAEHGLAIGFGDTGTVGISGITLGGGVGYLSRLHGLTIDNLLAVDLVTADGSVLRVDEQSHPDLFWAVRGGGGNVGVVTRFLYRLHPVDEVVGGVLVLPATPGTVAGFLAAAEAAPEALSTIANVMPCPPMPFVPAEHHGRLVLMGLLCFAGGADDGAAALAPFRALAEPLADMVQPTTYPELFPPEPADYHPTAVGRSMFVDSVDTDVAAALLEHLEAAEAPMRVIQLRTLGGAISRVPDDATAYAHRSRPIMANVAAFYDGPQDRVVQTDWVARGAALLDQGVVGAYVNFLGDEGPERVHAAYPDATWDRLAAIKATYDPTNLFHRNQNVPPAVG